MSGFNPQQEHWDFKIQNGSDTYPTHVAKGRWSITNINRPQEQCGADYSSEGLEVVECNAFSVIWSWN
jgi:hypothetical protein